MTLGPVIRRQPDREDSPLEYVDARPAAAVSPKQQRQRVKTRTPQRAKPQPTSRTQPNQGIAGAEASMDDGEESPSPSPSRRVPLIDLSAARAQAHVQRTKKNMKGKRREVPPKVNGVKKPLRVVTVSDSPELERSKERGKEREQPEAPKAPPTPHLRRRRTLDEELKHAGDHLWDTDDEAESGDLVSVGVKDNRRGFLARGGGGGSPVYMGSGYVQGFDGLENQRPHTRNHVATVL